MMWICRIEWVLFGGWRMRLFEGCLYGRSRCATLDLLRLSVICYDFMMLPYDVTLLCAAVAVAVLVLQYTILYALSYLYRVV